MNNVFSSSHSYNEDSDDGSDTLHNNSGNNNDARGGAEGCTDVGRGGSSDGTDDPVAERAEPAAAAAAEGAQDMEIDAEGAAAQAQGAAATGAPADDGETLGCINSGASSGTPFSSTPSPSSTGDKVTETAVTLGSKPSQGGADEGLPAPMELEEKQTGDTAPDAAMPQPQSTADGADGAQVKPEAQEAEAEEAEPAVAATGPGVEGGGEGGDMEKPSAANAEGTVDLSCYMVMRGSKVHAPRIKNPLLKLDCDEVVKLAMEYPWLDDVLTAIDNLKDQTRNGVNPFKDAFPLKQSQPNVSSDAGASAATLAAAAAVAAESGVVRDAHAKGTETEA